MEKDVPLAQYTTIGIGGPARFFAEARTEDEIVAALRWADENGQAVFVLGGGSNVLVGDSGFDGLVLKVSTCGVAFERPHREEVLVTAAAGEVWDEFVAKCVGRGLCGIECLSGIPGTVGGTPIQNVGAYGQEVSQTVVSVRCIDRSTLDTVEFGNAECGFSYRTSVFNTVAKGKYVVTSVRYRLWMGEPNIPEYPELLHEIGTSGSAHLPGPDALREAVLKLRRRKSMVVDPLDPNSRSLGSFFKNPVVEADHFRRLCSSFGVIPSFSAKGGIKIPAAWLIENAGFNKGSVRGNVGISANHSLALINRGGATAAEILAFRDAIADAVSARFGINLTMEPELV